MEAHSFSLQVSSILPSSSVKQIKTFPSKLESDRLPRSRETLLLCTPSLSESADNTDSEKEDHFVGPIITISGETALLRRFVAVEISSRSCSLEKA